MTDKNIQIRPTVTQIDGQLIESYERVTNAPSEKLEALGLDSNDSHYARIGIAAIPEYIRLIAKNISEGQRHSWDISNLGQDIEIDSIYIDSPNQDSFDLEVYKTDDNTKTLDLTVKRNQAPYDLPNSILTQDLTLKIYARAQINLVLINCRPAVLLRDMLSEETVADSQRA